MWLLLMGGVGTIKEGEVVQVVRVIGLVPSDPESDTSQRFLVRSTDGDETDIVSVKDLRNVRPAMWDCFSTKQCKEIAVRLLGAEAGDGNGRSIAGFSIGPTDASERGIGRKAGSHEQEYV